MEKINMGLIGLGYIGKTHLRNCLKQESVSLVAVADVSEKALKTARELGVKQTFRDYHQLLKQQVIDAVIISLPTNLHESCVLSAAEEGKHVFLEKPLATNPQEGKNIISATQKNNIKLMIGYPLRFVPAFVDLKRKIENGILGDIQTAHAVNIGAGPFFQRAESTIPRPVSEWWFEKKLTGGGALLDLGSHMINLVRWYFGEVSSVKAYLGYRFNFGFEDHALCIANFESETNVIINVGWFSQKARVGVELFGTSEHTSAYHSSPSKVVTAIQLLLGRTPKFFIPFREELSHFAQCIKEDTQPLPSGEDALRDLEIIAQAYKKRIHLD